jgi:nitrite reductase (NADH) large subunit
MDSDLIICTCSEVSRQQIVDAIRKDQLKTVDEVSEKTCAGLVCGGCRPVIENILQEIISKVK